MPPGRGQWVRSCSLSTLNLRTTEATSAGSSGYRRVHRRTGMAATRETCVLERMDGVNK